MLSELKDHKRYLEHPELSLDFGEEKWGVLFLNRGGPETAEDVEDYLYNIYSDPHVIDQPFSLLLQKPMARIISSQRSDEVARRFDAIGGSPLLRWTRLVASGVKRELSKRFPQADVFAGMRYSEPSIPDELDAAVDEGCRHIILFPMYPHYCAATTGTALEDVIDWLDDFDDELTVSVIPYWGDRPEYIAALRGRVDAAMENIADPGKARLVFVAHAVQEKVIKSNDPYLGQLQETARLAGDGYDYLLTFQPRSEPFQGIGPNTRETVVGLAEQGVDEIVVVPISFVSDHFGTLYSIDIELKEAARQAGIKTLIRTQSFNDDQHFTAFLADLIEEKIGVEP